MALGRGGSGAAPCGAAGRGDRCLLLIFWGPGPKVSLRCYREPACDKCHLTSTI